MKVIKRDGSEAEFDKNKIINAILKANDEVSENNRLSLDQINKIASDIEIKVESANYSLNIEHIQDDVEYGIMTFGKYQLAKRYVLYRYEHQLMRNQRSTDATILSLVDNNNELIKQENSNKNPVINPTQRDYIAGEVSKDMSRRLLIPSDIIEAHDQGLIHFHDMDYFVQREHNCALINLEDMLQNGTVVNDTKIDKPHTFSTACNIATQISAQVASSQYGGQTMSLSHLAPFVDSTRKKYIKKFNSKKDKMSELEFTEFIEELVKDDITKGIQIIQYQVNTLMTCNGQTPFITIYMDINEVPEGRLRDDLALVIEETLNQRIQGVKNEKGVWVTPAFPKLIYCLDENNVTEGSKYYYLTELSAKCTAKRMVPDYISSKMMRKLKNGYVYPCMGCRSFLTPYEDPETGKGKFYGRFNTGVVTINLVDVALSSKGDYNKFWEIYEERLELCHKALELRHKRLRGTVSDSAPILWQNGALARLEKGETIDKLLFGGYCTLSLGYAGLYECTKFMTGKSHTSIDGKEFAIKVMQKLNDKCSEWKEAENIHYSVYGTPIESTTYKFATCLQKRFGKIKDVTDHNYITNSYHCNVREQIDAFEKLKFEAPFQELSPGGAISYIEVPNMQNNISAILSVIKFIYDNIMYAEINTKSDYCQVCGYDGEIQIIEDTDGKLIWECPNCKNRDQNKMNVARRTCGYIGSKFWNQGRTQEIKERVLHL